MLRFDHIVPPPVAFYFNVTFEGLIETSWKEVSGLQLEMETETIKEGGENSFSYQVPTRRKHGNLVLKRSLMPLPHVLETYVVKVLEIILHSFKNAHLNILQSICYKVYSFNRETNKEQKIGIKVISCFSICTLFLSLRLFAFRVHSEQFYLLSSFEEFAPNFN